jgi:hypothetical protein
MGFMLMCEVALGKMNDITQAQYMEQAPQGFHSTKGKSQKAASLLAFYERSDHDICYLLLDDRCGSAGTQPGQGCRAAQRLDTSHGGGRPQPRNHSRSEPLPTPAQRVTSPLTYHNHLGVVLTLVLVCQ